MDLSGKWGRMIITWIALIYLQALTQQQIIETLSTFQVICIREIVLLDMTLYRNACFIKETLLLLYEMFLFILVIIKHPSQNNETVRKCIGHIKFLIPKAHCGKRNKCL